MNGRMDNQPTRISDKYLSLHSAKIRIINELFQFIQELHLNRSTISTLKIKMPRTELEIHQLLQDLQFNRSKIRIEN
jgi:hypothetical protein